MIAALIAFVAATLTTGGTVDIRDIAAEQPPAVHILVRVSNEEGRFAAGLDAGAFSVFEDGVKVDAIDVRQSHPNESEIAVAVLIDTSGSMKGDAINGAISAGKAFLGAVTPEDKVEIIAFGRSITKVVPFGQPADPATLDTLVPDGDTPMRDAMSQALDDLAAFDGTTRAIIVLTDGVDEGSLTPPDVIKMRAAGAGIPIHGVALGRADTSQLQQLIDPSTGSVRTVTSPAELSQVYASIAAELQTEYRISYASTASAGDHRVTVVVSSGSIDASDDTPFTLDAKPVASVKPQDERGSSALLVALLIGSALVAVVAFAFAIRRRRRPTEGRLEASLPTVDAVAPTAMPSSADYVLVGRAGTFPLVGTGIVVGRDPRAQIVVDDPTVSRTHARLEVDGSGVWVEDLGSANGTRVNGERISRQLLRPGDVLILGDEELELRGTN